MMLQCDYVAWINLTERLFAEREIRIYVSRAPRLDRYTIPFTCTSLDR